MREWTIIYYHILFTIHGYNNPAISLEIMTSQPKSEGAKKFCLDDLGRGIINSSYLIRGCVLHRAAELRKQKAKGEKLPFDNFWPFHYGNPQLLGQPPITFLREVIAACFCPRLCDTKVFSEDVVKRAKHYLKEIPYGAIGAYADAAGFDVFRKEAADFIAKRDGFPCDYNNIYLLDGTLDGMILLNNFFFSKKGSGMMLPMPEFPGYSFLAEQVEGHVTYYPLSEEEDWAIRVNYSTNIVRQIGGSLQGDN